MYENGSLIPAPLQGFDSFQIADPGLRCATPWDGPSFNFKAPVASLACMAEKSRAEKYRRVECNLDTRRLTRGCEWLRPYRPELVLRHRPGPSVAFAPSAQAITSRAFSPSDARAAHSRFHQHLLDCFNLVGLHVLELRLDRAHAEILSVPHIEPVGDVRRWNLDPVA